MAEPDTPVSPEVSVKVARLESEYHSLNQKVDTSMEMLKGFSNKLDQFGNVLASVSAGAGKLNQQVVIAIISVVIAGFGVAVPVIGSLVGIGYIIVKQSDDNLERRIEETSSTYGQRLESIAESHKLLFTQLATDQRDDEKDSREEYRAINESVQWNRVSLAELKSQLATLSDEFHAHQGEANHPYGVLSDMEKMRAETKDDMREMLLELMKNRTPVQ